MLTNVLDCDLVIREYKGVHTFAEGIIPPYTSTMSQILSLLLFYKDTRGSLNKFPDFLRMDTFIDSTYMKLKPPSK